MKQQLNDEVDRRRVVRDLYDPHRAVRHQTALAVGAWLLVVAELGACAWLVWLANHLY